MSQRWGCGQCFQGIPPSYVAQFQVSKRLKIGSEARGLAREGKRDLVAERVREALVAIPGDQPPTNFDAVFRSAEVFESGGDAPGPVLKKTLCRLCFMFAYMIPDSTFEECFSTVMAQNATLSTRFKHTFKTSASSRSSSSSSSSSRNGGTEAAPEPLAAAPNRTPTPTTTPTPTPAPAPAASSSRPNESTPLLPPAPTKDKTLGAAVVDFLLYGPPPPAKTKVPFEWWHAWDVAANCKEIFIRQREGDLAFLDGIRAIAYLWVLGDHLYQAFTQEIIGFGTWWTALGTAGNEFQVLSNGNKGDQGVTSFFFLSGFLIPFIFSRMVKGAAKESQLLGTPEPVFSFHAWEFLFRRYMRLAPTLYAGTLVAFLYGYFMKDVSASANSVFYESCRDNWWENMVFINNFSGIGNWSDCYDSVWTISVEYQLYILTIPVVFFYCWRAEYGWLAAFTWTLITVAIRIIITQWCDATGAPYGAWVYLPSWTRAPEYGVGMMSFFLYDHFYGNPKKKAEIKHITELGPGELATRISFQAFIFGILAFGLFYVVAGDEWWAFSYQQYESFSYLLWGLTIFALAQVTFENVLWPVKWILSWYFWYPIAQLAYTGGVLNMVICHGMATLIMTSAGSAEWNADTEVATYFIIFVSVLLLSLSAGLGLSLLVERPFMNLAKQVPAFYKLFGNPKVPLTSDVTAASTA